MIEAFANHISSHLGRHLLYWAVSTADNTSINLRLSDLINKFHAPLERGVQVLDHLLTLDEEDFNGHYGSGYIHNYQPDVINNILAAEAHRLDADNYYNQEVVRPGTIPLIRNPRNSRQQNSKLKLIGLYAFL